MSDEEHKESGYVNSMAERNQYDQYSYSYLSEIKICFAQEKYSRRNKFSEGTQQHQK